MRSLASESGLSRATASAVAAEVLPVAYARTFASPGAAYGWLRVAARHRACDSAGWAEAADAALVHGRIAAAAVAGLPAADRELLRLRYAEGLPAEEVAARTGSDTAAVQARLDAAVATATAVPSPRKAPADVTLPRVLAAAALALGAAMLRPGLPAPVADDTWAGSRAPAFSVPAAGRDAVDSVPLPGDGPATVTPGIPAGDVVAPAPPAPRAPGADDTDDDGTGSCAKGCVRIDRIHVDVPEQLEPVTGDEITVEQTFASEVVAVCDTFPAVPAGVLQCERGYQES